MRELLRRPRAAGAPREADPERVLEAVGRDKKRVGVGSVPFVLVEAIGEARTGCAVPDAEVEAAVRELAE